MAVKLTQQQQEVLQSMVGFAETFADQILTIMQHHGLTGIEGCQLTVNVDPSFLFSTETVTFGQDGKPSGKISLTKGRRSKDEEFVPVGRNSAEYELLFADETVRSILEERMQREKPLPPDGLWVSSNRNTPDDSAWEWDVNDSLS